MYYTCTNCKKMYQSRMGLFRHKKICLKDIKNVKTENNVCRFCDKHLSNYTSKWRHEKICKYNDKTNIIIKDMQQQINNLKSLIDNPIDNSINNSINKKIIKMSKEINNLKCNPTVVNIIKNETVSNKINNCDQLIDDTLQIDNNCITIYKNNYLNAIEICELCNKKFSDWESNLSTNEIIKETKIITNIKEENLIIKTTDNIILIHPFIASHLFYWLNPILSLKFNNWIFNRNIEEKDKEIKEKDEKIKLLINGFVKKQVRTSYSDNNVIYLITTEFHKQNRIYIVGKAEDLAGRLSTYNKTCDHEVIYYKSCYKKELLLTIENMVLKRLDAYREVANRDRFILPNGQDISFFTNIIDQSIAFFNTDKENQNTKSINKAKVISKIQQLLDEIDTQSKLLPKFVFD